MSEDSTNQFNQAARAMLLKFEELSRDALQATPASGGWSRQQVVQHLLLAYGGNTRDLERRIAEDKRSTRKRTLRDRMGQFLLLKLKYFPAGRQAPELVRPELSDLPPLDGSALATEYRRRVDALNDTLDKAQNTWGARVTVSNHPILGPLNVMQWRTFHALHTLHHCKQMDRILRALQS